MSLKKWIAVVSIAVAIGSLLSLFWSGDVRFLWTAILMTVVSVVSYAMASIDEEVKSD